jgi:hypothetical protein
MSAVTGPTLLVKDIIGHAIVTTEQPGMWALHPFLGRPR